MQAGLAHHGTILCLNADGRGKSGEVGGVQRNLAPSVDECCAAIRDLVTDYMQHQTPDVLMVQEFHWVGKSQDKLLDSLPGGDDSWGIYRHHHTDRRQQKNVPLLIFNKGIYKRGEPIVLPHPNAEWETRYTATQLHLLPTLRDGGEQTLIFVSWHGPHSGRTVDKMHPKTATEQRRERDELRKKKKVAQEFLDLVGTKVAGDNMPAIVGGDWNVVLKKADVRHLGTNKGYRVQLHKVAGWHPDQSACTRPDEDAIDYFCVVMPTERGQHNICVSGTVVCALAHVVHKDLFDHDPIVADIMISTGPVPRPKGNAMMHLFAKLVGSHAVTRHQPHDLHRQRSWLRRLSSTAAARAAPSAPVVNMANGSSMSVGGQEPQSAEEQRTQRIVAIEAKIARLQATLDELRSKDGGLEVPDTRHTAALMGEALTESCPPSPPPAPRAAANESEWRPPTPLPSAPSAAAAAEVRRPTSTPPFRIMGDELIPQQHLDLLASKPETLQYGQLSGSGLAFLCRVSGIRVPPRSVKKDVITLLLTDDLGQAPIVQEGTDPDGYVAQHRLQKAAAHTPQYLKYRDLTADGLKHLCCNLANLEVLLMPEEYTTRSDHVAALQRAAGLPLPTYP